MNPPPKKPLVTRMTEGNFFGISSFFGPIVGFIIGIFIPWQRTGGHPSSLVPEGLVLGVALGCLMGAALGFTGVARNEQPIAFPLTCAVLNLFLALVLGGALMH